MLIKQVQGMMGDYDGSKACLHEEMIFTTEMGRTRKRWKKGKDWESSSKEKCNQWMQLVTGC